MLHVIPFYQLFVCHMLHHFIKFLLLFPSIVLYSFIRYMVFHLSIVLVLHVSFYCLLFHLPLHSVVESVWYRACGKECVVQSVWYRVCGPSTVCSFICRLGGKGRGLAGVVGARAFLDKD